MSRASSVDDLELGRRSVVGFGEMIALLGRWGAGEDVVIRRPDVLGARIDAARGNPWFDAAVVPIAATPPADEPALPSCVWTVEESVPGRVEKPGLLTPCMGVPLDDPRLRLERGGLDVAEPSLAVLGEVNERAYESDGTFGPLVRSVRDERLRTYGLREEGAFVSVAAALTLADDVCIHYVATEASHRRRGLASSIVRAIMADARDRGLRTATLQASPEGLSVYERIGFRRVAALRAYLRPG
jgi:GNAT superfamily N-acetyltransferase